MRYKINALAVQVGDIVLTSSNGLVGRVIRAGAGGDFTHALTCCDPTVLMEAVGEGVRKISLRSIYVSDANKVVFLQSKNGLEEHVKRRYRDVTNRLFSTRYSAMGAVRSVTSIFGSSDDLGIFCSQLVTRCHIEAETGVFNGLNPQKVTPHTIQVCPELMDVSDQILIEVDWEEVEALEAVDGGLGTNPVRRYQEYLRKSYENSMLSEFVKSTIDSSSPHRPENLPGLIANIAHSRLLASVTSATNKIWQIEKIAQTDGIILQCMRQQSLFNVANKAVGIEFEYNLNYLNHLVVSQ